MARQNRKGPARATLGLGENDLAAGSITSSDNTAKPAAQRLVFALQAYYLLSDPMARMHALVDPRLVELFRRIIKGQHDCSLCGATLNLDPESLASPGVAGFIHGDLGKGVDAVVVAACLGCTLRLGDEGTSLSQGFVDTCAGGGSVRLVQGGVA